VRQNAPVLEVFDLVERIDAADERHGEPASVALGQAGLYHLARFQSIETFEAYHLAAVETERLPARAGFEDERDDAHADEVGAMDALERLRNHGLDAKQVRALRRP